MASYILVKAQDGWNLDDPMVYMTGYMVDVRNHSRIGGKQVPPKFIQIEITDDDDAQGIQNIYCREWRKEIDWEFVGHDYSIDGHRLRVFVKPEFVSVSGLNSLTRDQVETFLNRWNATVVSIGQNEVVFDATVFNAIKSDGFWNRDVSLVGFTEIDYNSSTGVHRVEANYSASDLNQLSPDQIESYIVWRGGVINKHPTSKVTFDINRIDVFAVFKQDVRTKTSGDYNRRSFKLLQQHIDIALANNGTLSVTRQQFAQYIYNRLND